MFVGVVYIKAKASSWHVKYTCTWVMNIYSARSFVSVSPFVVLFLNLDENGWFSLDGWKRRKNKKTTNNFSTHSERQYEWKEIPKVRGRYSLRQKRIPLQMWSAEGGFNVMVGNSEIYIERENDTKCNRPGEATWEKRQGKGDATEKERARGGEEERKKGGARVQKS